MKLRKITAYEMTDAPEGTCIFFVPSGYKGVWLEVFEDYTYTIDVDYFHESQQGGFQKAIEEAEDEKS